MPLVMRALYNASFLLIVLIVCGAMVFKNFVVSKLDRDGIRWGGNVLQVNVHWLIESDF